MPQRARPAIHIDLVSRDTEFMHEGHWYDSEGLIYLPQINIFNAPSQPVEQLLCGWHGGSGKLARLMRMTGMSQNTGPHLQPLRRRIGPACNNKGRRTIRNG